MARCEICNARLKIDICESCNRINSSIYNPFDSADYQRLTGLFGWR